MRGSCYSKSKNRKEKSIEKNRTPSPLYDDFSLPSKTSAAHILPAIYAFRKGKTPIQLLHREGHKKKVRVP